MFHLDLLYPLTFSHSKRTLLPQDGTSISAVGVSSCRMFLYPRTIFSIHHFITQGMMQLLNHLPVGFDWAEHPVARQCHRVKMSRRQKFEVTIEH